MKKRKSQTVWDLCYDASEVDPLQFDIDQTDHFPHKQGRLGNFERWQTYSNQCECLSSHQYLRNNGRQSGDTVPVSLLVMSTP
jgi:hypothetical protein